MKKLSDIYKAIDSLDHGWHTKRAMKKALQLIKNAITSRGTKKAQRYAKGKLSLTFNSKMRPVVKTDDTISNIIEHGFKTYNWGLRVLSNPRARNVKFDKKGNRYKVIRLRDRILQENIYRVVSEKSIRESGGVKWRMNGRRGEYLMRKSLSENRSVVNVMIRGGVLKDLSLDLKRKFKK